MSERSQQTAPRHGIHRRSAAVWGWLRGDWGRRLRLFAGVDEKVLDRVPLERVRYTGLGGVVLGTAIVAGLSMWFALSQVLGNSHIAMIIPVAIWALIVLNLDRWLVSTATGLWQRRLLILIPRLFVAAVLGIIIAEPLVLRVFETAVVQHVEDQRQQARDRLRAQLVECNPTPPAVPKRQDCGGSRLLAGTPEANATEIAKLEGDAKQLQRRIDEIDRRHNKYVETARKECAGEGGRSSGYSGLVGEGPRCRRAETESRQYLAGSGKPGTLTELASVRRRIANLRAPLAAQQNDYQGRVDAEIGRRIDQLPAPGDTVGLLERMKALDELTLANTYLATASWLVRLLLVLIDCLPVLVKLMGGTTAYDRVVGEELRHREEVQGRRLRLAADKEIGDLELEALHSGEQRRHRRQQIELDRLAADGATRTRREELIFERETALRRKPHVDALNGAPR
ncbi:DUF4407 domain-containing protein [Nonomuraea sp. NPDC046802]|uniref:DUF4407 domain-containing protein n=1 Tax=Nonomuraea sp. NPDC046802 TaxID=3154919 RepID=UPI0033D04F79